MTFPGKEFQKTPKELDHGWNIEKLEEVKSDLEKLNAASFLIITCGYKAYSYGAIEKPLKLHSIRKSLLNSLYGIFIGRKVINEFSTLEELSIDDISALSKKEKKAMIKDLLMSRSGVYLKAAGETSTMKMMRPKRGSHRPGEFFYYNNWDFNTLGSIFVRKTGEDIFQMFEKEIAKPLMMQDFKSSHGNMYKTKVSNHGVYQFKMSARDLARFGHLYLAKGNWGENVVLPPGWVEKSFILRSTGTNHSGTKSGYGFLWWGVLESRYEINRGILAGSGLGTQKIYIVPGLSTVIVFLKDTSKFKGKKASEFLIGTKRHDLLLSKILTANRFYKKF